jgi:hypothetical protein
VCVHIVAGLWRGCRVEILQGGRVDRKTDQQMVGRPANDAHLGLAGVLQWRGGFCCNVIAWSASQTQGTIPV